MEATPASQCSVFQCMHVYLSHLYLVVSSGVLQCVGPGLVWRCKLGSMRGDMINGVGMLVWGMVCGDGRGVGCTR